MEEEKIIFCKSGGCTAKLGAGVLEHILEKLPKGKRIRICWWAMTAKTMHPSTG